MGVDEALLRSAAESGLATLRLYAWRGPWLSLGYAQEPLTSERSRALEEAGVGVVRRATGGRAVLHGSDLTYAVAAPEERLAAGLRGSYDQVARALLAALRGLGVDARQVESSASMPHRGHFDCFARAAGDEICVGNRKLAGSAQRRIAGAVLQHGSLRMEPDPTTATTAAGFRETRATSLREIGCAVEEEVLREACVDAFARVLKIELVAGSLTGEERRRAEARGALTPDGISQSSAEQERAAPGRTKPCGDTSRQSPSSR
jgi:lipoate-protein ligase A